MTLFVTPLPPCRHIGRIAIAETVDALRTQPPGRQDGASPRLGGVLSPSALRGAVNTVTVLWDAGRGATSQLRLSFSGVLLNPVTAP
ncbi:MAG: hypothetical protein ACFBRM_15525 [Pikeienuella sp.]